MNSVETKGTFTGFVVGPDGKPISHARVFFNCSNPPYNSVDRSPFPEGKTGLDGRFILDCTAYYRLGYRLVVEHPELAQWSCRLPTVFPESTFDLGTITLVNGPRLHITIHNQHGEVVSGVTATLKQRHIIYGSTHDDLTSPRALLVGDNGFIRTPPLMTCESTEVAIVADGYQYYCCYLEQIRPWQGDFYAKVTLVPDDPLQVQFIDQSGNPIANVQVLGMCDQEYKSNEDGFITIRGEKHGDQIELRVDADGYVWSREYIENWSSNSIVRITLCRKFVLRGRVVDASTLRNVAIDRIVMCQVERDQNGVPLYSSCLLSEFEQPELGTFEVEYSGPGEIHLQVSAEGYNDSEAFVVCDHSIETEIRTTIHLEKAAKTDITNLHECVVRGTVSYRGHPLRRGWIAVCQMQRPSEINCPRIHRGRIVGDYVFDKCYAMVIDGQFVLPVSSIPKNPILIVESSDAPMYQSDISLSRGTELKLTIEIPEGASIEGMVLGCPGEQREHAWVVAFGSRGYHIECQVSADGRFAFRELPHGALGLKVGWDGFADPNLVASNFEGDPVGYPPGVLADPWLGAERVELLAGQQVHVTLKWPE
jgi:hypothetical protein